MGHYLVTWHETDGNDCTVYDSVIEAATEEKALSILAFNLECAMNDNKTPYSEDGSEFGYYFDCSDDCDEECDGHGGICLRTVEVYATDKEAHAARSPWHTEYACFEGSADNTLTI